MGAEQGEGMVRERTSPFGDQLRRLREAAGLTQEELAERSGLSRDAVSALERGHRRHPHPHTVRALAIALGLSDDQAQSLRASIPTRSVQRSSPTPDVSLSALPVPATRLVGRQREIEEIRLLFTAYGARLVTLTGPGGVGKTRLGLELAREMQSLFPGVVAFASLASVNEPALVFPTIAEALGVRDTTGHSLASRLARVLGDRDSLLLLDNLEQLESASPVAELLGSCPGLSVLATSRAALRLSGEHEYPVPPLGTPSMGSTLSLDDMASSDAVTLFEQRARAVRPDFTISTANADAIAGICTRLDGLPLAIELAAALVKVLPPEALLARLGSGLGLLVGGPRDQSARLQSMRAAIAWSYDLLDADERALFRRLSIFEGGFSLEAAETVTASLRGEERAGVFDGVVSLVDKSLLRRLDPGAGDPGFGMLMTIREFGLEQLATAGEAATVRFAHAAYVLGLAEQAAHAFRQRTEQERWLDRLEAERGNIRAALTWLDKCGDTESLLQLAGALSWFWYIRGPLREGRSWLERALATPPTDEADEARVRALVGAGLLAHFAGDDDQAQALLEASLAQISEAGDPWLRAFALLLLGMVAEDHGDYPLAEVRFVDALGLFRAADDPSNASLALNHLGVAAWGMGDIVRAAELCEEAVALQRAAQDTWGAANSLGYLGLIAAEQGDYGKAAEVHRESLRLRWQAGVWEDVAGSLADLAVLAALVERPEQAARLFGAATALREEAGRLSPNLPERAVFERAEARARSMLGEEGFARAQSAGRSLPVEQAVTEAAALADEIAGSCIDGD